MHMLAGRTSAAEADAMFQGRCIVRGLLVFADRGAAGEGQGATDNAMSPRALPHMSIIDRLTRPTMMGSRSGKIASWDGLVETGSNRIGSER